MKAPARFALSSLLISACASGPAPSKAATPAAPAVETAAAPSGTPGPAGAPAPAVSPAPTGAPASGTGPASASAAAASLAANSAPGPAAVAPLSADEGALLYATACTSCHTGEFVAGSRISLKGWTGEVAKMRKWGAPVEEEQAAPLAAWLAQKYPVGEAPPAAETITAAAAAATVQPQGHARRGKAEAGGQMFAQACASCHGAAAKGLGGGPSLVENPVVHQPERFAKLVHEGKGRMPGFDAVTPAQMDDLLAWLMQPR